VGVGHRRLTHGLVKELVLHSEVLDEMFRRSRGSNWGRGAHRQVLDRGLRAKGIARGGVDGGLLTIGRMSRRYLVTVRHIVRCISPARSNFMVQREERKSSRKDFALEKQ